jgi:hypothetical protein
MWKQGFDGQYFLQLKGIEFSKGKNAIIAKDANELEHSLNVLSEAILAGELDEQLMARKSVRGAGRKKK